MTTEVVEQASAWAPPIGTAGHTRMTTDAGFYVAAALRTHALGDRISWDAALQLITTPDGPRPLLVLYFSMPSAVLGEIVGELVMIEPQHATAENIDRQVVTALERLRKSRSASAALS